MELSGLAGVEPASGPLQFCGFGDPKGRRLGQEGHMPLGTSLAGLRSLHPRSNRFLAALPASDFALLAPHLRTAPLPLGAMLHEAEGEIAHVYFPQSGMISLVVVMRDGATVETATVGRGGAIGSAAGLGSRCAFGRAVVQLAGTAARIPIAPFHHATEESPTLRALVVGYNDVLIGQIQQSVACNALHSLEARLCRWLLQTHDCVDGDTLPLTQEFLGQMLGVRRTTVTVAARLLQASGLISYRRGHIHLVDRPGRPSAVVPTGCFRRRDSASAFSSRIDSASRVSPAGRSIFARGLLRRRWIAGQARQ
jgi:CRP-like cAMP-binding protein